MDWISMMAAAIAPGISLLAYFYLKDRYDAEPIKTVAKIFVLGALLVFPTMVLQRGLVLAFGENEFIFAFAVSGGVEEFFKWFVIYYLLYKHSVFDEPYDGIVYAVAVSLGFATLENVLYALLEQTTFYALLWRALLPVSGHALFGVIMGYYLGKAKFTAGRERKYLLGSLMIPLLWHGLFDLLLLKMKSNSVWFMLPLMAFLWVRGMRKVNRANAGSPFRTVYVEEEIKL